MPDRNTVINTIKNQLGERVTIDRNKTAPSCRNCMYHHPEFKYRTCLFSSCPYGKGEKCIFRDRPLSKEFFPPPDQECKAVIRSA